MIKVLIVDDSQTETQILKNIIESERNMQVIAYARNGKEAVKLNAQLKPDLITMDIQMPIMNGIQAIQEIMSQNPVPIVVISSKLDAEMKIAFEALEKGALYVLDKPVNILSNFEQTRKYLVSTLLSMAEIKVIKHRMLRKNLTAKANIKTTCLYEMIAVGASVGGPQALKLILSGIPKDFPIPIVVVQHMTPGFMNGFVKWLNNNVPLNVTEATHNQPLEKGSIYFAPDNHHIEIERENGKLIAKLITSPPVSGFCPSITVLLQSVAKSCGKNAIGVLLTGMGSDGANGMLALKQAGGHTLIQDPNSAVVFGMARVAQSLGAVDKVIDVNCMADYLINLNKG